MSDNTQLNLSNRRIKHLLSHRIHNTKISYTSLDDALGMIQDVVEKCGARDAELTFDLNSKIAQIVLNRGWGMTSTITIKWHEIEDRKHTAKGKYFTPFHFDVQISWTTTSRNVHAAHGALQVYTEQVNLMTILSAKLEQCGTIGLLMDLVAVDSDITKQVIAL